jgi:prevent-host-death family protein
VNAWSQIDPIHKSRYNHYIVEKTISAADANRKFSEVLRGVREGQSYVVTSHGRPVARIEPVEENSRVKAKEILLAHLESRPVRRSTINWTRDELYDRPGRK